MRDQDLDTVPQVFSRAGTVHLQLDTSFQPFCKIALQVTPSDILAEQEKELQLLTQSLQLPCQKNKKGERDKARLQQSRAGDIHCLCF